MAKEKNVAVENGKSEIEQRREAAKEAIKRLKKKYGEGAVQTLGDGTTASCDSVSTGILPLDIAVGVHGLPRGRIIEIYGPESAGKTLIALQTVAEVQKNGGMAAYIDVENALNVEFARKIGVNVDELVISQPDNGEQALEIASELIRSGGFDILVIDSVAALITQQEIDGDMGDAHIGLLARLMSQSVKKLNASIAKTNTPVIFINQLREKIGTYCGPSETTPGGRALKFYASVRLDVRKKEQIKKNGVAVGNKVKVKVVKNKVAPPFRECEFDLMFDSGADKAGCLTDAAVNLNIIEKSGSWFSYNGTRIGQGRDSVVAWIKEDENRYKELENLVYQKIEATDSSSSTVNDSSYGNPVDDMLDQIDDSDEYVEYGGRP